MKVKSILRKGRDNYLAEITFEPFFLLKWFIKPKVKIYFTQGGYTWTDVETGKIAGFAVDAVLRAELNKRTIEKILNSDDTLSSI